MVSIKKEDTLKYLMIAVFLSFTFCFIIKLMAFNNMLPWTIGYSDINGWSKKAFEPGMPYIDKGVEYPIIIGMVMYAASRFGLNYYFFFHYGLLLLCTLITTKYIYKLSEKMKTSKKNLFVFWAIAPSMLWFSYFNWDIITVMFSVLALYYYLEKKDIAATILLSLGFMTKMYPILLLFPVLLHRRFKDWVKIAGVFAATFFLLNIYFMIKNFGMWAFVYTFNSTREPNIDSIWHVLMQLSPGLTISSVNLITLFVFGMLYIYLNLKYRMKGFIVMSFFSIMLFMFVNKVFSPQYTLWLLPFFALFGAKKLGFYGIESTNIFVLFATLPYIFSGAGLFWTIFFVATRHISLAYLLYTLFKKEVAVSSSG